MVGSFFLFPALLALLFSLVIVRAGAMALRMTGVDKNTAQFQALSAFSGTGFTTREAETVMGHGSRRRIITLLIVTGNVGIITMIVSATTSLVASQGRQIPVNLVALIVGAAVIYFVVTRSGLTKRLDHFIENRLTKSGTFVEAPVEDLLRLGEGYGLLRGTIAAGSHLDGCTLAELRLTEKGVLILGIERGLGWLPIPKPGERMAEGDRVVAYGPLKTIRSVLEGAS